MKRLACCLAVLTMALGPARASAEADPLLALLPKEASGILFIDVPRAMASPSLEKLVDGKLSGVLSFLEEAGLDDGAGVHTLAGAVADEDQGGVFVVRVDYEQETVLRRVEACRWKHAGVPVLGIWAGGEHPLWAALLDGGLMAFGSERLVTAVIAVHQSGEGSILSNNDLMMLLDDVDTSAPAWGAFLVKDQATQRLAANPMLGELRGLRSFTLDATPKDCIVGLHMALRADSPEENARMGTFLTQLKSLGAAAGAQSPILGGLLGALVVDTGADRVALSATVPNAVFTEGPLLAGGD